MKKKSQNQWVKDRLCEDGVVTRNQCLSNYITRLSAIIQDLEREGFIFHAHYEEKNGHRDFVYEVKSSPFKRVEYRIPALNKTIVKYERQTTQ